MPAFRSVVSVLVSFVGRSFSTNSRPALRAAACGGRPRPAEPRHGSWVWVAGSSEGAPPETPLATRARIRRASRSGALRAVQTVDQVTQPTGGLKAKVDMRNAW